MFIALKYGAVAMAAATAYRLYMKQNGGPDPKLIALDEDAQRRRNLMAWDREPGRPRAIDQRPARNDPKSLVLDDAAMNQRAIDAYHRGLRMPKL